MRRLRPYRSHYRHGLGAAPACRARWTGWDLVVTASTIAVSAFLGGGAVYLMTPADSEDRTLNTVTGAIMGSALGATLARTEMDSNRVRQLTECMAAGE